MATSKDWPTIGADYAETRYSKLAEVNVNNVKDLGLMWTYNLESTRGVEATPLVVDGIMYVTASWSTVHAIDVRTGKVMAKERFDLSNQSGMLSTGGDLLLTGHFGADDADTLKELWSPASRPDGTRIGSGWSPNGNLQVKR